jgi:hypothetical protein
MKGGLHVAFYKEENYMKKIHATKVYELKTYLGETISATEAKSEGISTKNLPLASIESCRAQIQDGDLGNAYGGPIEVLEGIFEFNFDTGAYVSL